MTWLCEDAIEHCFVRFFRFNTNGDEHGKGKFCMSYLVRASKTLTLWHGGNLDYDQDSITHKGGRWEYGPGLYLITTYSIAMKYAKGSRKLYQVTISEGTDIKDVHLPMKDAKEFLKQHGTKSKLKDVFQRMDDLSARMKLADKIPAENFLIIIINEDAVKSSKANELRSFIVSHGIDYWIVDNAFGFTTNRMVVLFNSKRIVSKERMSGREIEEFDLPTKFS